MQVGAKERKRRLGHFEALCREHGLKVTHQRREIFKELTRREQQHADAETVFRRVRRRLPTLSLDTVYRTLALLEARGLVRRVALASNPAVFDANPEEHCHFVCRRCGRVDDLPLQDGGIRRLSRGREDVGRIERVDVHFGGLCRTCLKKERGKGDA